MIRDRARNVQKVRRSLGNNFVNRRLVVKRLLILAVATACSLGTAYAQDEKSYECRKDGDVRTVTVEYSKAGAAPECSVYYKKSASASGEGKELWHYQSHIDQCEAQALQFRKKLEGFGLACSELK
jgi:hypothetical protein